MSTSLIWERFILFWPVLKLKVNVFNALVKCATLFLIVTLFASPFFTIVYTATLETFPGAVFLVQAAIFIVSGIGFTYVYFVLTRSGQDFAELVEETDDILKRENSTITD